MYYYVRRFNGLVPQMLAATGGALRNGKRAARVRSPIVNLARLTRLQEATGAGLSQLHQGAGSAISVREMINSSYQV